MAIRVRRGALLALVLIVGCGDADLHRSDGGMDAGDALPRPDAEPRCTTLGFDPDGAGFGMWPDPTLLVEDPSTRTGYRLEVEHGRYPMATEVPGFGPVFFEDLASLDGFGINAALYFRFGRAFDTAMLPSIAETGQPGTSIGLIVVSPGPVRAIPVEVKTSDGMSTLILIPQVPLPERAKVAAFVTKGLTDAARGCIEPSPAMTALLDEPSADVSAALTALTEGGFIEDTSDLVALNAYPTQSIVDGSVAIAADIEEREPEWIGEPVCRTEPLWRRCEWMLRAADYREADTGAVAEDFEAVTTYELPVTFWLPLTGDGLYPTLLFGHGLSSGRQQAARLAEFAAPRGFATVAIDAPQHGEHPTTPEGAETGVVPTVLRFFAVGDLSVRIAEGQRARDHFRQATYDKLQLLRAMRGLLDVDGDDVGDIDEERLAYLGVSLGGIMGPELLALTDVFKCAVLVVPGGRVSSIVSDGPIFRPLLIALRPRNTTEGDVDRFFPVLQTVLERGDPASYAPHVLRDRLRGEPRSLLMGMVLDDEVVPNVSNFALARALGLDLVPPILREEPGLDEGDAPPVRDNIAPGVSAGLLQFDRIEEGGNITMATHDNIGASEVGVAAWLHFIETAWSEESAEIIDPYEATGLER